MAKPLSKQIRNYLYTINTLGYTFNLVKKYYIAQTWAGGYLTVKLTNDKGSIRKAVHKIVAEMWCPNPDKLKYIIHKNGNLCDNRANNLKWVDYETAQTHKKTVKHVKEEYNMCINESLEAYRTNPNNYKIPEKFKNQKYA